MKNVIVTGVSGFIGDALIKKLQQIDIGITVLTHSSKDSLSKRYPLIRVIQTDFIDVEWLFNQLKEKNYDCIYHLAWDGSTGQKRGDKVLQKENINRTIELYHLSCKLSCKTFIVLGTISEKLIEAHPGLMESHPQLWYAWAKRETYLLLHKLSLHEQTKLLWAQLPNVYGPHNQSGNLISYTLESLKIGNELRFTKALQPYDLIYIDDLVTALILLESSKNLHFDHYYIGSGEPKLLKDFLTFIISTYGYHGDFGFGKREEDGLVFDITWFDSSLFTLESGFKVSKPFEIHMKLLIDHMKGINHGSTI